MDCDGLVVHQLQVPWYLVGNYNTLRAENPFLFAYAQNFLKLYLSTAPFTCLFTWLITMNALPAVDGYHAASRWACSDRPSQKMMLFCNEGNK